MMGTNTQVFAYDFVKKEIHQYYKKQYKEAPQEKRQDILTDMQHTVLGLETLSDQQINTLVENPRAHFYILHKLPLPKKFRQSSSNSENILKQQEIMQDLCKLGIKARKMEKFRNKLQPFLVFATLLSAGAAIYAAKSNHDPKPAAITSAASLVLLIHNKRQNDLLPPFPKVPDFSK